MGGAALTAPSQWRLPANTGRKTPVRMELLRCCPSRGWAATIFLIAARIRHRTVDLAFSAVSPIFRDRPPSPVALESSSITASSSARVRSAMAESLSVSARSRSHCNSSMCRRYSPRARESSTSCRDPLGGAAPSSSRQWDRFIRLDQEPGDVMESL